MVKAEDLTLIEKRPYFLVNLNGKAANWKHRNVPAFVMSDGPNGVRRQTGSGDHLGLGESKTGNVLPYSRNSGEPVGSSRSPRNG